MSSGSESDDEYVPEEPEKLSEEDSADDETEKQYENEVEVSKKRKVAIEAKSSKKRKTEEVEDKQSETEETTEELDPVEAKKKEDDLWSKFLEGTDVKPKSKEPVKPIINEPAKPQNSDLNTKVDKKSDDAKEMERKIFEFAGETIVVENNVIKEKIKTEEGPATVSAPIPKSRGSASGLSGVLGQLNKKSKLSTLEKSKLDWTTYKKDEGIEEEIQSHNKGKQGFLERRDFLERADYRQYEIERDLRMNRRSKR